MAARRDSQAPSPILSVEELHLELGEGLARAAGQGAAGGRFAARFLRLDGEQRTLSVARTDHAVRTVREEFLGGVADEDRGPVPGLEQPVTTDDTIQLVGIVGSGVGGMNPCVVQIVWTVDVLLATAHAKEGLIRQGTCRKALDSLERTLAL